MRMDFFCSPPNRDGTFLPLTSYPACRSSSSSASKLSGLCQRIVNGRRRFVSRVGGFFLSPSHLL